jgi:hypothetical protein
VLVATRRGGDGGGTEVDQRRGAVIYALLALLLLAAAATVFWFMRTRDRRPAHRVAAIEYWVYTGHEKPPSQDEIMTMMVRDHPLGKPLAPSDAILFSDIRLHIGFLFKHKNPHVFSPHVVASGMDEEDKELLAQVARAEAAVRLRFLSEEPLTDDKHLRFMPYLAHATAALSESPAVYDASAERLMRTEKFVDMMAAHDDLATGAFHVRTVWTPTPLGGRASTRGLVKVGLPEIETADTTTDQQILIMEVLEEAAAALVKLRDLPESLYVQCFDDTFELQIEQDRKGPAIARVVRIQTQ